MPQSRAVKKKRLLKNKSKVDFNLDPLELTRVKAEPSETTNLFRDFEQETKIEKENEEAVESGVFIDIDIKVEQDDADETSSTYESVKEHVDAINLIIANEEDLNNEISTSVVRHDSTKDRIFEEPLHPALEVSNQLECYSGGPESADVDVPDDSSFSDKCTQNLEIDKPYKCELCDNFATKYRSVLRNHLKFHMKCEDLRCPECSRYFGTVYKLRQHYRTHTGEKPYRCEICGFSTSHASSYKYHMRTHRGEKPYVCPECNFRAVSCTMLTRHLRVHTGEKPFQCNLCDYKARAKGTLKSHLRTHTGEKPFSCNYCDKSFVTSSAVRKHLLIHMKNEVHKCSICGDSFNTRTLLREHMITHGICVQCKHCGTKPGSNTRLVKHMERSKSKKPLKCSVCHKVFEYKCAYTKHLKRQDKCRPFKCSKCDYRGPTSASLRFHRSYKHSGRLPKVFKCDDCRMDYDTKAELSRHICVLCQ